MIGRACPQRCGDRARGEWRGTKVTPPDVTAGAPLNASRNDRSSGPRFSRETKDARMFRAGPAAARSRRSRSVRPPRCGPRMRQRNSKNEAAAPKTAPRADGPPLPSTTRARQSAAAPLRAAPRAGADQTHSTSCAARRLRTPSRRKPPSHEHRHRPKIHGRSFQHMMDHYDPRWMQARSLGRQRAHRRAHGRAEPVRNSVLLARRCHRPGPRCAHLVPDRASRTPRS